MLRKNIFEITVYTNTDNKLLHKTDLYKNCNIESFTTLFWIELLRQQYNDGTYLEVIDTDLDMKNVRKILLRDLNGRVNIRKLDTAVVKVTCKEEAESLVDTIKHKAIFLQPMRRIGLYEFTDKIKDNTEFLVVAKDNKIFKELYCQFNMAEVRE